MFAPWIEQGTAHGSGGWERWVILKHMPGQIAEAPILGNGTGAWPVLFTHRDWYAFPHNMFGEITVENGIIGLLFLIGLWWIVIKRVLHCLRRATPGTPLYGVAIFGMCWLAYEFVTGSVHFGIAHASCTFLLTSGITLRITYLAEHAEEEREEDDATGLVRPVLHPSGV
jgi:hypothetical protein